jgi:hypothetical protein
MDNNDYRKLIEEFYQNQYSSEDDNLSNGQNVWVPDIAGPEKIERLKMIQNTQQVVNATTFSAAEMKQKINDFRNIKIGNFIIKITTIYGPTVDVLIYEELVKTKPANITVKINPNKDSRFQGRSWTSYFNRFNVGKNIPIEEIYNIFRWLQAIYRMPAFL